MECDDVIQHRTIYNLNFSIEQKLKSSHLLWIELKRGRKNNEMCVHIFIETQS